jgi:hypothetical protein
MCYTTTHYFYISPVNITTMYANCVFQQCIVGLKHLHVLLDTKCTIQYLHEEGLCVCARTHAPKPGSMSCRSLHLFHFICQGCQQMDRGHTDFSQGFWDAWHKIQRLIACLPTLYKLLTSLYCYQVPDPLWMQLRSHWRTKGMVPCRQQM